MEVFARSIDQVGAAIRRHRRRIGLNQADLGQRANVRQATISALERGEVGVQLRTLLDVISALGLELVIRERSVSTERLEDLF